MFDPFGAIETLRSLAESDSQIRAAAVSGSLTDPQGTPDLFSDCDAAFFVRDLERAKQTDYPALLAPRFGGLVICQCPDAMGAEAGSAPWFTWLMQFEETRIDLRLLPVERAGWYNAMEPGLTPFLDKDGLFDGLEPTGHSLFSLHRPTSREFADCCNELLWTSLYVVKGLCRGQLEYAVWHMNHCVLPELVRMVSFDRGFDSDYAVSLGAGNKYLSRLLLPGELARWHSLYDLSGPESCASALMLSLGLFRRHCTSAAGKLGYPMPAELDRVEQRCRRLLTEYRLF